MSRSLIVVVALVACVLVSAVAVVEVKHQSRGLFVTLESLRHERDDLNTEWSRLRLEQGALAMHSRVERLAGESLGLRRPQADDTTLIWMDRGVLQR